MPQAPNRPVDVRYHSRSRLLELRYADGRGFELPAEYLRVFAGPRGGDWPLHKEGVCITALEPVGDGSLRLHFDDGFDGGLYEWAALHGLAEEYESNWRSYEAWRARTGADHAG